jgi:hypothetical protein
MWLSELGQFLCFGLFWTSRLEELKTVNSDFHEAIPKLNCSGAWWFDKLTTNETNPFVLSLSKDIIRPSLNLGLVHLDVPKYTWGQGVVTG